MRYSGCGTGGNAHHGTNALGITAARPKPEPNCRIEATRCNLDILESRLLESQRHVESHFAI